MQKVPPRRSSRAPAKFAVVWAFLAALAFAVKMAWLENYVLTTTVHAHLAAAFKIVEYGVLFYLAWNYVLTNRFVRVGFYALMSLYLFAQLEYHCYFSSLGSVIGAVLMPHESKAGILTGYSPHWQSLWMACADLPFILLALTCRVRKSVRVALALVLLLVASTALVLRSHYEQMYYFNNSEKVKVLGLPYCEFSTVWENVANQEEFQLGPVQTFPEKSAHPNIILIQVESLGAKLVSAEVDGVPVMPQLHELSKHCLFFPLAFSYHGAGGSSDADFAMEASTPPLLQSRSLSHLGAFSNSISHALGSRYKTVMFHGNDGSFWNRRDAYQCLGFDSLYFLENLKLPVPAGSWGIPDSTLFAKVLDWSRQQKQPYFAHVITISTHIPFTWLPQAEKQNIFRQSVDGSMFRSFHYFDGILCQFLQEIAKQGNTWVIITGDHTPPGQAFKDAKFSDGDQTYEFVPMFVIPPTLLASAKQVEQVQSYLDLAPTVLSLAGVATSIHSAGHSLLEDSLTSKRIPYYGVPKDLDRSLLWKQVIAKWPLLTGN